ncbi:hypothetical protein MMC2321_03206 [Chitinophaga sp. MM2321]
MVVHPWPSICLIVNKVWEDFLLLNQTSQKYAKNSNLWEPGSGERLLHH